MKNMSRFFLDFPSTTQGKNIISNYLLYLLHEMKSKITQHHCLILKEYFGTTYVIEQQFKFHMKGI